MEQSKQIKLINKQMPSTSDLMEKDYEYYKDKGILQLVEDEIVQLLIAIDELNELAQSQEYLNKDIASKGIVQLIQSAATRDPNRFHYNNVRSSLSVIEQNFIGDSKTNGDTIYNKTINQLKDRSIVAQLAVELTNFCHSIYIKLSNQLDGNKQNPSIELINEIYLNQIGMIGHEGKEAQKLLAALLKKFEETQNHKALIEFWLRKDGDIYISDALIAFGSVYFKEKMQQRIIFAEKYPPAGVIPVMHDLATIASPGNSCKETDGKIQIYTSKNEHIGIVPAQSFDAQCFALIRDCSQYLDTIYAVRFFEYLLKSALDCYKNDNKSYDLEFPGRAKQLAKALGFSSGTARDALEKLITLFDNVKFNLPCINSRILSIAECKPNSIYSSKGGWIITILPPLRPFKACQGHDFLSPLLQDPPLVGHRKHRAKQYLLKWAIAEEFSIQSVNLTQDGYAIITDDKWEKLFYNVGLPKNLLSQIRNAIIGPNGYLKMLGTDRYMLSEDRMQEFLERQGALRMKKSAMGKKSQLKKTTRKSLKSNKKSR